MKTFKNKQAKLAKRLGYRQTKSTNYKAIFNRILGKYYDSWRQLETVGRQLETVGDI